MANYKIEKDNILNYYIVWEIHKNYEIDIYKSKLKMNCKRYVEKNKKNERKVIE